MKDILICDKFFRFNFRLLACAARDRLSWPLFYGFFESDSCLAPLDRRALLGADFISFERSHKSATAVNILMPFVDSLSLFTQPQKPDRIPLITKASLIASSTF